MRRSTTLRQRERGMAIPTVVLWKPYQPCKIILDLTKMDKVTADAWLHEDLETGEFEFRGVSEVRAALEHVGTHLSYDHTQEYPMPAHLLQILLAAFVQ